MEQTNYCVKSRGYWPLAEKQLTALHMRIIRGSLKCMVKSFSYEKSQRRDFILRLQRKNQLVQRNK